MKMNEWKINIAMNDGQYYRLIRAGDGLLSLECWADDGSGEIGGPDGQDICEVSESAFSNLAEIAAFASDVGDLLDADPVTIIKAIRG